MPGTSVNEPDIEYTVDILIELEDVNAVLPEIFNQPEWRVKKSGNFVSIIPDFAIESDRTINHMVQDFLDKKEDELCLLRAFGSSRVMLLGVFYNVKKYACVSVEISGAIVKRLADLNLGVEARIYPCA